MWVWVRGLELKSSGLSANTFTHWAIRPARKRGVLLVPFQCAFFPFTKRLSISDHERWTRQQQERKGSQRLAATVPTHDLGRGTNTRKGDELRSNIPRNFYKLAGKGNRTPSCSILEGDGRKTRPGVCNQRKLLFASHSGGSASLLKHGVLRIRQHLLLTVQSQPSCVIKASPSVAKFPNFTSKDQILPC